MKIKNKRDRLSSSRSRYFISVEDPDLNILSFGMTGLRCNVEDVIE